MADRKRIALGIDVGSTNTKAVLVETDEHEFTVLARASAATPDTAGGLVAAALALVAEVTAAGAGAIDCVGIASMAESGVALSKQGDPLTPVLRWDGSRGAEQAEHLGRTVGARELFDATGVQLSAKTPLATWRWLRDERRDVFGALRSWAGVADLLALAMTGRLVTDHTLAGRTMGYRLPQAGADLTDSFDAGLLSLAGLDPERMPTVGLPGGDWPVLTDRRFIDAGLPAGIPVVVAGHDHSVAAFAAGARLPGDAVDSMGTAEAILLLLDTRLGPRPYLDRAFDAGFNLVRGIDGRGEALLGGSSSAGAMIGWWRGQLGDAADSVFEQAAERMPARAAQTVLPYLRGRQCPFPDSAATVGPAAELTAADTVDATVALFEGIAFQARWMLDAAAAIAETVPGTVTLCAGPEVVDSPLVALKAALSPVPLRLADVPEPVAIGAALISAERAGLLAQVPAATTVAVPRARHGPELDSAYRRFVATAVRQSTDRRSTTESRKEHAP